MSTTIHPSNTNGVSSSISETTRVTTQFQVVEYIPSTTNGTIEMVLGSHAWVIDVPNKKSTDSLSISKDPENLYQTQILPVYLYTDNGTETFSFGTLEIYIASESKNGDNSVKISSILVCLILVFNTFFG
ncbi:hypothetical protein KGF54_001537 [Candida jiufengensis]|uniref:uncharacterized protein n=1 Tax=Candida jiufengensis TaxID=497108 RepID=UPI002223FB94|nr:uncharacterized protein KGF54_001537 [Candida jiufengensis]KAI5954976.1 hypothetical protein KGF54_001537 [Candida jiufengensis]